MQIRDGLTMHGSTPARFPEELELRWVEYARAAVAGGHGFPNRPDATGLVELDEETPAFVSENRWVVDCPSCGGGAAATVGYPRACCFDCGTILARVLWPARDELAAGVAALELRPARSRHWRPMDETAQALRFENITHGYPIPGAGA